MSFLFSSVLQVKLAIG